MSLKWSTDTPQEGKKYYVRQVGSTAEPSIRLIRDIGGMGYDDFDSSKKFPPNTLGWFVNGWPSGWWEPCDGRRHPDRDDKPIKWEYAGPIEDAPE